MFTMGPGFFSQASTGGPSDPYFSSVSSLLHFDGTNGSTTFTDQKSNTWTASANAQIDTTTKQYGTGSGHFSAVGSYIDATVAGPGTSDFTIEQWVKWSGDTTNLGFIFDWRPASTNGNYLTCYISGGTPHIFFNSGDLVSGGSLSTSAFLHVAYCRSGSSGLLFIGGSQVGSTITDTNNYQGTRLRIAGSGMNGPGGASLGWMDDFRLTVGVARYTSNFTPPTAAFPDH